MNSSDFEKNTFDSLLSEALSKVPDDIDKREGSIIYDALAPACYHMAAIYLELKNIMMNAFVDTAYDEFLDLKVAEQGLKRKEAINSIVKASFYFTDDNLIIKEGMRFSSVGESNLSYTVIKIEDKYNCLLKCETPGICGNSYIGDILPISYINNLITAKIVSIISPGDDLENDSELKLRYKLSLNRNSFGGNIDDYIDKINSIDGVGGCQVYPTWNGGGTVKCSVVDSNLIPIQQEFIQIIQDKIDPKIEGTGFGLAPIGHRVTISTATEKALNITATIQLLNGYTIEQLQEDINNSINNYLTILKQNWSIRNDDNSYNLIVYNSQIIAAILKVFGVANVINLKVNNLSQDLILEQSTAKQELPKLGSVVFA